MSRIFWRMLALCCAVLAAGCGGGGGGGSGGDGGSSGGTTQPYANVQPPAAPAPESIDTTRASGTLVVSADTYDNAGRVAGLTVELHAILADGTLGPARASGSTGADGSFTIAMPAGTSTADGSWMLLAPAGGTTLRAYLHRGGVRLDVGSEAWVRQVSAAAGRLATFPGGALDTAKSIARSLTLYADSTGADRATLTLNAAADQIVSALATDHAMSYVLATLRSTGALPTAGTGDIGAFSALSATYAALFRDDTGTTLRVNLTGSFGATMGADGTWSYRSQVSSLVNGVWTPVAGSGSDGRSTASRSYGTLPGSGVELSYLSSAVGEYPEQSFPVQTGARQLDARRIENTQLNFTGGTVQQPISFSLIETVGGVESVSVAAGTFRAVRVVSDLEIGVPKADGGVQRLTLRTTQWLAPGAGLLKELDQSFVDGAPDAANPSSSVELTSAYANATVWPGRVTLIADASDFLNGTHFCPPLVLPALRRIVTTESGPSINGTPRLALALWDMDTRLQVGSTRVLSGNSTTCPVAGSATSVLVPESFSERNLLGIWPADAATAASYSDVVHQVSGSDLSDLASYRLAAVPDVNQPTLFHPAWVTVLSAAPDDSGDFVSASVMSNYLQLNGSLPLKLQVLGPGRASPVADVGSMLVAGVDWSGGRIFLSSGAPQSFDVVPFTRDGVDASAKRVVRDNFFVPSIWYASTNYVHLYDGSSFRISDGGAGPSLPFPSSLCGVGSGVLVCVNAGTDSLVKLDPDTGVQLSTVGLGSDLRALTSSGPDFSTPYNGLSGIRVLDASTFGMLGIALHVGRWP